MKKTLIALAAVAVSTGAMAQAHNQVTISGTLDVSGMSTAKVATTASGANPATTTVKTTSNASDAGNWATSELRIGGSEDLGNGLTASFQINTDLRRVAGDAFASRDKWLQLSGGFGSIRLGNQGSVAGSDGFHGYTQTGTVGVGSTYSLGVAGGIARQTNVINYTSPSFNGVTVMVGTARPNTVDSNAAALQGKAGITQNSVSVTYAAGPLRVGAGTTTRKLTIEAANAAAQLAGKIETKANFIGASYNMGVATVGASIINNDSKTNALATRDQKLTAIGVTVPMGAITLRASTYNGKDSATPAATSNIKHSGNQLSVTYALSKRTQVYAYTGKNQTKRDGAASTAEVAKTTGTHVGLTHSF